MEYVNICLNNAILATTKCIDTQDKKIIKVSKQWKGKTFPDNDKLYAEDLNGYSYRRIDFCNKDLVFEKL